MPSISNENEDPLASKKISIFPREREGLKQEQGKNALDPWPIRFHLVETSSSAIDPDHESLFVYALTDVSLRVDWQVAARLQSLPIPGEPAHARSILLLFNLLDDRRTLHRNRVTEALEFEDFGFIIVEQKGERKPPRSRPKTLVREWRIFVERKRNEYFIIAYDIFDFSEQSVDRTRDRVTRGFGEFEDWNRVRHNSITSFTHAF